MTDPIRTIPQRTILSLLLDRGEDFVKVHPVYLRDVMSLQQEGLISYRELGGEIEVRLSNEQTQSP